MAAFIVYRVKQEFLLACETPSKLRISLVCGFNP
jgi:hypothetical protein